MNYFDWLLSQVDAGPEQGYQGRYNLFKYLYSRKFEWVLIKDENRATDAEIMRNAFEAETNTQIINDISCLEVMIALCLRIENEIMSDPESGDRTYQWFIEMLNSLDLFYMIDRYFDEEAVCTIVDIWLSRSFEPNGKGSLFTVSDNNKDMRDVEIWYQAQAYLHNFLRM